MLEKNPKWKGKPIISIVFEDGESTFDDNDCLVLSRYRMKPIKVKEYVYNLQNNPQFITNADEKLIIKAIKGISNGQYTDLTNKCAEPVLRISQNPPDELPTNQENINCNRNMNKKLIRLTESDLHRIVKESVNKVLRENRQLIREFDDDDFGIAYDKNGNEIHEGDIVIWIDPETGRKTKYQVYEKPTEDMVKLWNKYGECEAYPQECVLVKR